MSTYIKNNLQYITFAYTFGTPDGHVLGSSQEHGPMVICQGNGDTIVGLDNALANKNPGDTFEITIEPEDAYGAYDATKVYTLPRSAIPLETLTVGMRLNINSQVMTVTDVNAETVVVDANHPCAGVPLHFSISVIAVDREKPAAYQASCACGSACSCADTTQ